MENDTLYKLLPKPWHVPIIYHPVQHDLVTNPARFSVVCAARRSGKTFRLTRYMLMQAFKVPGKYAFCSPTNSQTKKIFWSAIKAYIPKWLLLKEAISDQIFYLKNGSEIHVFGLERTSAARVEGIPWVGILIDEFADLHEDVWPFHVRPALSTKGINSFAFLCGCPDGLNHYYDHYRYAESGVDREWKAYTWISADIVEPKEIEAAKRTLSPQQFAQEYLGSWSTATGRIYPDYSKENHTDRVYDPNLPIYLSCDFNYLPASSSIYQITGKEVTAFDEIILESATSKSTAEEFVYRYKGKGNKKVYLGGDPAGRQGIIHNQPSDYSVIEEVLRMNGFIVESIYKRKAESLKDSQNALRAKILNAHGDRSFFVNPNTCRVLDKGISIQQFKKGSATLEEENYESHVVTSARYLCDTLFPVNRDNFTSSNFMIR